MYNILYYMPTLQALRAPHSPYNRLPQHAYTAQNIIYEFANAVHCARILPMICTYYTHILYNIHYISIYIYTYIYPCKHTRQVCKDPCCSSRWRLWKGIYTQNGGQPELGGNAMNTHI